MEKEMPNGPKEQKVLLALSLSSRATWKRLSPIFVYIMCLKAMYARDIRHCSGLISTSE